MDDTTEIERAFAGLVLHYESVIYETDVDVKHIHDALAREVYATALRVSADGDNVSLLTVTDASKTLQARAADVAQLTSMAEIGSRSYLEKRIVTAYKSRELRKLALDMQDNLDDPDALMADMDVRLADINAASETDRVYRLGEMMPDAIKVIEERYNGGGALPGISTGFPGLDRITSGLQDRAFYVVGARPSQGKSAILLNMVNHIGLSGTPVGIISAESSKEELLYRTIANAASVDSTSIKTGLMRVGDFQSINDVGGRIYKAPIYVYDVPNVPLSKLLSTAKAMCRKHDIKALFVDYIQIIESALSQSKRNEQVAEISKALKGLSRTLRIPVVAAAQLTRDSENRRPALRDFGESSQIEKDADAAILLHHEDNGKIWAHVDKHRDGPTGSVPLHFKGKFVRFTEEAQEEI